MNFKKTLIASSISAASMALTPLAVNAVTISSVLTPSFTEVTLDATGLLITNTGGIDLSTSSFSFPALRVESSLAADIDIDDGGFISAVNTGPSGTFINPTGILFATIEGNPVNLTGSITNNGTITAEAAGIFLANGSVLTGDIINGATGVITSNSTLTTNAAAIEIQQNINPSSPGTGITGGFNERSLLDGSITNSGVIDGLALGNGINVNVGEITGSITNNAGALITSGSDAAIFIDSSTIGAGITNSGTISGVEGIALLNFFDHTATFSGGITNNAGANITGTDSAGIVIGEGTTFSGGISNGGTITAGGEDAGAIDIYSDISGGTLLTTTFTGNIDNTGVIQNNRTGVATGELIANGIFLGAATIDGSINNTGGTISSAERAAILLQGFQVTDTAITVPATGVTGNITNTGSITGLSGIAVHGASVATDISNSGSISGQLAGIGLSNNQIVDTVNGTSVGSAEAALDTVGGNITNTGSIINTATAAEVAGLIGGGATSGDIAAIALSRSGIIAGDIVNGVGGVISSDAASAISVGDGSMNASTVGGDIDNSGDIMSSEGTAIFLNNGVVGGLINNAAGGIIDGADGGILVIGSTITGGLSNAGAIDSLGPDGPALNNAYAIDIQNSTVGAVNNAATGVITGGFILENSTVTGDFTNAGTLQSATAGGDAYVMRGVNSTQGDLINSGSISAAGMNAGVIVEQGAVLANIVNSGTVSGGAAAISAIDGGSQIGTITNNAGGVLNGGTFGVISALNGGTIGSVVNAGTINGLTDFDAGGGDFTNSGSAGAVVGADSVTNSGTLGDVVLVATGGSFSSTAGTVGNVSNVLGDVVNGGALGNLTFTGAGGDLTNTGTTGDIAGVTGVTTSGDMGNVQFVAGGGDFISTAGDVGSVNGVSAVDNGGTLVGINFVTGGGTLINSGTVSSDIVEAISVLNDGTLDDVTMVAAGGAFTSGGGTVGNVSNVIGSAVNAGSVGDISFLNAAGNTFFSTGNAGNITNVDLVSNSGGNIGNVTFQAMGTGVYTSVGNTSVGTIDGAASIQVLMEPQAAGVTTATVDGDLNFNGLLFVQASSAGAGINDYSRLAITGNADVTGVSVFVLANGIDLFAQGDGFDFLTAGGTLASDISTFGACDIDLDSACEVPQMSITDNSTVIDFKVVQNGSTLRAVIGDVDFTNPIEEGGNTGNKNVNVVAGSLSAIALAPQPTPPGAPAFSDTPLGVAINRMVNIANQQGQDALVKALGSLDAETIEGGSLSALQADTVAASTIDNRTAALRGYYGFSGTMAGDPLAINGFWLQGYGNETDQGVRDGVDGFDADTYGVGIGADAPIGERVMLGVAFSYADTDVNMKQESRNQMIIDSYRLSVYGSYNADNYYLDGQLAYAMNDYDTERAISPLLSVTPLIAKGKHDGDQYNMRIRGGYPIATESGWFVTPTAEMNYTFLSEDSYTERGAGNLGLQLAADDVEVLVLSVGVKMAYPITTKNEVTWIPEFSLNYAYDTIGDEVEVDSNFVGVTGAAFITNGANVEQEALKAGFKVRAFSQGNFSFSAGYDYVDKQDYDSQSLSATVRYDF